MLRSIQIQLKVKIRDSKDKYRKKLELEMVSSVDLLVGNSYWWGSAVIWRGALMYYCSSLSTDFIIIGVNVTGLQVHRGAVCQ